MADNKFIPKGNIKHKPKPLPPHIIQDIKQRNHLRSTFPNNQQIDFLNQQITNNIKDHKKTLWTDFTNKDWSHRTNQDTYWKTIKSLNNKQHTFVSIKMLGCLNPP